LSTLEYAAGTQGHMLATADAPGHAGTVERLGGIRSGDLASGGIDRQTSAQGNERLPEPDSIIGRRMEGMDVLVGMPSDASSDPASIQQPEDKRSCAFVSTQVHTQINAHGNDAPQHVVGQLGSRPQHVSGPSALSHLTSSHQPGEGTSGALASGGTSLDATVQGSDRPPASSSIADPSEQPVHQLSVSSLNPVPLFSECFPSIGTQPGRPHAAVPGLTGVQMEAATQSPDSPLELSAVAPGTQVQGQGETVVSPTSATNGTTPSQDSLDPRSGSMASARTSMQPAARGNACPRDSSLASLQTVDLANDLQPSTLAPSITCAPNTSHAGQMTAGVTDASDTHVKDATHARNLVEPGDLASAALAASGMPRQSGMANNTHSASVASFLQAQACPRVSTFGKSSSSTSRAFPSRSERDSRQSDPLDLLAQRAEAMAEMVAVRGMRSRRSSHSQAEPKVPPEVMAVLGNLGSSLQGGPNLLEHAQAIHRSAHPPPVHDAAKLQNFPRELVAAIDEVVEAKCPGEVDGKPQGLTSAAAGHVGAGDQPGQAFPTKSRRINARSSLERKLFTDNAMSFLTIGGGNDEPKRRISVEINLAEDLTTLPAMAALLPKRAGAESSDSEGLSNVGTDDDGMGDGTGEEESISPSRRLHADLDSSAEELFASVDIDGDGTIVMEEFKSAVKQGRLTICPQQSKATNDTYEHLRSRMSQVEPEVEANLLNQVHCALSEKIPQQSSAIRRARAPMREALSPKQLSELEENIAATAVQNFLAIEDFLNVVPELSEIASISKGSDGKVRMDDAAMASTKNMMMRSAADSAIRAFDNFATPKKQAGGAKNCAKEGPMSAEGIGGITGERITGAKGMLRGGIGGGAGPRLGRGAIEESNVVQLHNNACTKLFKKAVNYQLAAGEPDVCEPPRTANAEEWLKFFKGRSMPDNFELTGQNFGILGTSTGVGRANNMGKSPRRRLKPLACVGHLASHSQGSGHKDLVSHLEDAPTDLTDQGEVKVGDGQGGSVQKSGQRVLTKGSTITSTVRVVDAQELLGIATGGHESAPVGFGMRSGAATQPVHSFRGPTTLLHNSKPRKNTRQVLNAEGIGLNVTVFEHDSAAQPPNANSRSEQSSMVGEEQQRVAAQHRSQDSGGEDDGHSRVTQGLRCLQGYGRWAAAHNQRQPASPPEGQPYRSLLPAIIKTMPLPCMPAPKEAERAAGQRLPELDAAAGGGVHVALMYPETVCPNCGNVVPDGMDSCKTCTSPSAPPQLWSGAVSARGQPVGTALQQTFSRGGAKRTCHSARTSKEDKSKRRGVDTAAGLSARVREALEKRFGSIAAAWASIEASCDVDRLTLAALQNCLVEAGIGVGDAGMLLQAILESKGRLNCVPGDPAPSRSDFIAALSPGRLPQSMVDVAARKASAHCAWWCTGRSVSPNLRFSREPDGLSRLDAQSILSRRVK